MDAILGQVVVCGRPRLYVSFPFPPPSPCQPPALDTGLYPVAAWLLPAGLLLVLELPECSRLSSWGFGGLGSQNPLSLRFVNSRLVFTNCSILFCTAVHLTFI